MGSAKIAVSRKILGTRYGSERTDKRRKRDGFLNRPLNASVSELRLPGRHRPKREAEEPQMWSLSWTIVKSQQIDINVDTVETMLCGTKNAFRVECFRKFIDGTKPGLTKECRTVSVEIVAEGVFPTNLRIGRFVRVKVAGDFFPLPKSVITKMRTG